MKEIVFDSSTPFAGEVFTCEGWPGRIFHYPELPSTNILLIDNLKNASTQFKNYDGVWTDYQSRGKGRRGRQWIAPNPTQGQVLTFSIALPVENSKKTKNNVYTPNSDFEKPHPLPEGVASLPQVAAWVWATLIKEAGGEVSLKWPNDILFQGKKLAGLLTETITVKNGPSLVLGMGINLVFDPDFLIRLENHTGRKVSSLKECLSKGQGYPPFSLLDPRIAIETFLKKFYPMFKLWQAEGFAPFAQSWGELSDLIGKRVTLISEVNGRQEVMVEGIGEDGRLIVDVGGREIINFGEIEY